MSVAAGLAPAGVVNALKVTTPQQVMLKVRFVEADRTATRNLGKPGLSSNKTATWLASSEPSRVAVFLTARCSRRA
jgi:Flp pilus assembly secretin CpaC